MLKKIIKKHLSSIKDANYAKKHPDLIRIYFEGFMSSPYEWFNDFYLKTLIPNHKNTTIISSYKPHIIFNSVFSTRPKKTSSKRIFWTGEEVQNNYPDFSDNLTKLCDASFGFDYLTEPNYLRLPLWILYYFHDTETKEQIKKRVDEINNRPHNPQNFTSLIARHDRNGIRRKMIELIKNHTGLEVSCAGPYLHNDDRMFNEFNDDKVKYLQSFMFNICPENIDTDGYVTEKLFQSFDAGCIPLYWGCKNPEPQVVNPKAILNLASMSESDFTQQVKELWTNRSYYNEFIQNKPLLDTSVDFIFTTTQKAKQMITEIFEDLE